MAEGQPTCATDVALSHGIQVELPQDDAAKRLLLEQHQPLILSAVRKAHTPIDRIEDAKQAAALGFLDALSRLDPARAWSIGAYAKPFVLRAVLDASWPDRRRHKPAWRNPESAGQAVPGTPVFLPFDDAHVPPVLDAQLEAVEEEQSVDAVHAFVRALPPRQRYVARRLFWDEVRAADIARELGVSRAAVSSLIRKILTKGGTALATFAMNRKTGHLAA